MKRLLAALLIVSAGTASARHRLETGSLEPSSWADTETTTNLVFEIGESEMRNFVFSLDFEATPSNNVEVAFGKDADGNGTLTPEEQELTAGWDCGKWLVAGRSGLRAATWGSGVVGYAASPVSASAHKTFSWTGLVTAGTMKSVAVTENGMALDFGFPNPFPVWFCRPDWDLVRITVRGVDNASERFAVKATRVGTLVIIR